MSATPATTVLPLRVVRRILDRVERALRPAAADEPTIEEAAVDEVDVTTTRELLVPATTGEPAATRASRQAQDYLERRRRQLSRQLDDR